MDSGIGKRIIVIGSPGSGKSTLSRKLGEATGIGVHHMDRMFWLPNWTERDRAEFDGILSGVLGLKEWIIDGNYQRTLRMRAESADTVIFLDFNRFLCLYRVLKRIWKWKGRTRPDMGEGCEEKFDYDFLKWIWNYRKREKIETLKLLESLSSDKRAIVLRNARSVSRFLKNLPGSLETGIIEK